MIEFGAAGLSVKSFESIDAEAFESFRLRTRAAPPAPPGRHPSQVSVGTYRVIASGGQRGRRIPERDAAVTESFGERGGREGEDGRPGLIFRAGLMSGHLLQTAVSELFSPIIQGSLGASRRL